MLLATNGQAAENDLTPGGRKKRGPKMLSRIKAAIRDAESKLLAVAHIRPKDRQTLTNAEYREIELAIRSIAESEKSNYARYCKLMLKCARIAHRDRRRADDRLYHVREVHLPGSLALMRLRAMSNGTLRTRCLDVRFWMCQRAGLAPLRDVDWDLWRQLSWKDHLEIYIMNMLDKRMKREQKRRRQTELDKLAWGDIL